MTNEQIKVYLPSYGDQDIKKQKERKKVPENESTKALRSKWKVELGWLKLSEVKLGQRKVIEIVCIKGL